MVKIPDGHEQAAKRMGTLLKQARGSRDQREIARLAEISDSALSRFETGQQVPELAVAHRLDEVLYTGELITRHTRAILFGPVGATVRQRRRLSIGLFPPEHVGPVHVHVGCPQLTPGPITLNMRWGPWSRETTLDSLDPLGYALIATKRSKDLGEPDPLRVTTSIAVMATFGCEFPDLPDDRIIDANGSWQWNPD